MSRRTPEFGTRRAFNGILRMVACLRDHCGFTTGRRAIPPGASLPCLNIANGVIVCSSWRSPKMTELLTVGDGDGPLATARD